MSPVTRHLSHVTNVNSLSNWHSPRVGGPTAYLSIYLSRIGCTWRASVVWPDKFFRPNTRKTNLYIYRQDMEIIMIQWLSSIRLCLPINSAWKFKTHEGYKVHRQVTELSMTQLQCSIGLFLTTNASWKIKTPGGIVEYPKCSFRFALPLLTPQLCSLGWLTNTQKP